MAKEKNPMTNDQLANDQSTAVPDEPKVVDKRQAEEIYEQATADLPPAGFKRDELLRMRKDELERLAEEIADGRIAVREDAFEIDREIQDALANALTGLQEDKYVYCLACTREDGRDVWEKKALGWEVVSGDMPEARNLRTKGDADSTRRIGDTILMRMTKERYVLLRAKQERAARHRAGQAAARAMEIGEDVARRTDGKVRLVNPATRQLFNQPLIERMESGASRRRPRVMTVKEAAIRQQAMKGVDQMIRSGTVPGMKPSGNK